MVLQRLGVNVKATLPYETTCPHCRGRLWVYGPTKTAPIWLRCMDCDVAGDPIGVYAKLNSVSYEMAADAIFIGLTDTGSTDAYGLVEQGRLEAQARHKRAASAVLDDRWSSTSKILGEYGITDNVIRASVLRQRFIVGRTKRTWFSKTAQLRPVDAQIRANNAIVLAYDQMPGYTTAYHFMAGESGEMLYRVRDTECGGLAFLDCIDPSSEEVVVIDHPALAIRIHNEYLRGTGYPAPLLLMNKYTSLNPWSYVKHQSVTIAVQQITTAVIQAACFVHGTIFCQPDLSVVAATLPADKALLRHAIAHAVPWDVAAARYMEALPGSVPDIVEGLSAVDRASIAAKMTNLSLAATVTEAFDPVYTDPNSGVSFDRSMNVYRKIGEAGILCDVEIRFERALRWESKKTIYVGYLSFAKRNIVFSLEDTVAHGSGVMIKKWIVGTLQDAGVADVPVLDTKHLQGVLDLAQRICKPPIQTMEQKMGWAKRQNAFVFPWFSVAKGKLETYSGGSMATADHWTSIPADLPVLDYAVLCTSSNARALMYLMVRYLIADAAWLSVPTVIVRSSQPARRLLSELPRANVYQGGTDLPQVVIEQIQPGYVCVLPDKQVRLVRLNGCTELDLDAREVNVVPDGFAVKFTQNFLCWFTKAQVDAAEDHDQYALNVTNGFLRSKRCSTFLDGLPYKRTSAYDALCGTGSVSDNLFRDETVEVSTLCTMTALVPGFNFDMFKLLDALRKEGYDANITGKILTVRPVVEVAAHPRQDHAQ